jgi:hypothetical protein
MLTRHSKEKYMKRKYEYPEMEIIEFDTKDVITTSGVSDDDFLNGLDHVIDINNGNGGWTGLY